MVKKFGLQKWSGAKDCLHILYVSIKIEKIFTPLKFYHITSVGLKFDVFGLQGS